ncbi:hypothetical protein MPRF_11440 [Mycolicibacterium parafortuitum]|uniref:Uncharacterized protein n=1 Tax=Mycolicibacterium parafortuitum TaxID=39692 RepID=A0A7I7U075_MYCPF|nr:hypothetical protein MPRF_11440 [Mycolicibacterium parafortuitum]
MIRPTFTLSDPEPPQAVSPRTNEPAVTVAPTMRKVLLLCPNFPNIETPVAGATPGAPLCAASH